MNLMAVPVRESLDNFGEGAFRAMAAVHKGRKDCDTQVRSSLHQGLPQKRESSSARWRLDLAGEREYRGKATGEN